MKAALYGGSFNPPHIAHIFSATYISMVGGFDRTIIYPCYSSPTGKKLIDFDHRLKMCKMAFGHIPNVIISEIEKTLPEPSYTINTINAFKELYPSTNFRLIVGSDIIANQHLWKKEHLEQIYNIAKPFVLGRTGFENGSDCEIIMPDVSSTNIRNMLLSNDMVGLAKVLPENILRYIVKNNLYV